MSFSRSVFVKAVLAGLAGAGLGVAQARDNIYWNVGVDAAPGVTVGVGNSRPVVVQQAPVYVQPQPIYVAPQVAYPREYYYVQPAPVYVRPAPVYQTGYYYGPPGHWKHKDKHNRRHWKGHHHGWDD